MKNLPEARRNRRIVPLSVKFLLFVVDLVIVFLMETILFLLFGSLVAGAGVWALSGGKERAEDSSPFAGGGRAPSFIDEQELPPGRPVPVNRRGKRTAPSAAETGPEGRAERKAPRPAVKKGEPLTTPYKASDIIPPGSKFEQHRRPLRNADSLVEKQKGVEAVAIYERLKKRIHDGEIQNKIDANIQAIRDWLEAAEEPEEVSPAAEMMPMEAQARALENLSEGLRALAENLARQFVDSYAKVKEEEMAPHMVAAELLDKREALPYGDFSLTETGEVVTDGWTDTDFEREWEKFKNLPLRDQRSGDDRRSELDRRSGGDGTRKDRRSPDDRRKEDLFKEREEFLKKLEKHKKNKELFDQSRRKSDRGKPFSALQLELEEEQKAAAEPGGVTPLIAPAAAGEGEGGVAAPSAPGPAPAAEPSAPAAAAEAPAAPAAQPSAAPAGAGGIGAAGGAGAGGGGEEEGAGIGAEEEFEEELPEAEEKEGEKPPVQEIRGVLELKPPEEEDAPFLTLTYDFGRIPDSFKLSQNYHTMEYAYYKYKPMLIKAQEFTRRKMLKNALNYYRVIKSQNIPPEFKRMVNRNIQDITDYLEKFLMRKGEG